MTLDEYQQHVMRTANRGEYPSFVTEPGRHAFDAMTWALGLTGEAGEVADLLKKGFGHGHGVDHDKIRKELGDVLWYIGALSRAFGLTLDEVAQANVAKLKARYPDGFTVEASKAKADECFNFCTPDSNCATHRCNRHNCYCPVPTAVAR